MAKRHDQLKPHHFKKGKSGNPEGRPPLTPEQKALRKLTLSSYQEIIEVALTGNFDALLEIAKDRNQPAIRVGVARAIYNACKIGDSTVLERFAARIVGEIPKVLNVNGDMQVNHSIKVIPPEIARQALLEIEEDV